MHRPPGERRRKWSDSFPRLDNVVGPLAWTDVLQLGWLGSMQVCQLTKRNLLRGEPPGGHQKTSARVRSTPRVPLVTQNRGRQEPTPLRIFHVVLPCLNGTLSLLHLQTQSSRSDDTKQQRLRFSQSIPSGRCYFPGPYTHDHRMSS